MKTLPLFLAAAACQSVSQLAEPTAPCSLSVRFGSYAMGIDGPAAAAIDTLLARSTDVKGVTKTPWGREGEYTLCVTARDAAASARLFRAVVASLPATPRGPISVEGAGGRADAPAR